ncbi:DMT family transporter [Streptomyces sp. NPDC058874]|uniref:DMT family transporter n=1 Tax=unclassified Streptomyces TaxID=2593676 RepID=UPI0036CD5DAA
MILSILLALLNGAFIVASRAINGRLSTVIGPFRASLWNHLVGFLFLTTVLVLLSQWEFGAKPPLVAYIGGVVGALFVVVSSYVFPRLGAMNAALLVISGQMITAVLIDWQSKSVTPGPLRWLGVVLVLLGVYLSRVAQTSREARNEDAENNDPTSEDPKNKDADAKGDQDDDKHKEQAK